MNKTRVLVAFKDDYRVYRESIAIAIQGHRPHAEVMTAEPSALEAEVVRLTPQLIICSLPKPATQATSTLSWVELSTNPNHPSRISITGGRCWESANPSLEELLSVFDEAEKLIIRANSGLADPDPSRVL